MPFGSERVNVKTTGFETHFTYTDQEHDAESGLLYYGTQYYHPVIGRFTSVDPVVRDNIGRKEFQLAMANPQLLNSYAYVANNPLKHVDEDGEFLQIIAGAGIGALISGGITYWQTGDIGQSLKAAGGGAVAGGLFAAIGPASLVGTIGTGALSTTAGNTVTRSLNGEEITAETLATDAAAGAVGGAIGYGVGKAVQYEVNKLTGKAAEALPDNTLCVRGGQCTAEQFRNASGVQYNKQTNMLEDGVSINSAPNKSVEELSRGIKNGQIGVTTAGDIRKAGGNVIPSGSFQNPNHATLQGITPESAQKLFQPTIPNPSRIKRK